MRLVRDLGLDGMDIDWEYPQNDKEAGDWVELLRCVRKCLDEVQSSNEGEHAHEHAHGRQSEGETEKELATSNGKMLLTVACPAGAQNYTKLHLRDMDPLLDFWNLMAYDYAGSWDRVTAHQANLYPDLNNPSRTPFSTSEALDYYIKEGGIAPEKMVIGMPLYGRAFANTNGLGEPFQGTGGEGSWEAGVWDYKVLPKQGAEEVLDERLGASWSDDKEKKVVISYDACAIGSLKAEFLKMRRLGGAMWWESSGDRKGEGSLIETVSTVI